MAEEKIKLNRTENTVRNIISGFINKLLTTLLPFVVRTVLIKTIGIEYLGLCSLFTSILTVLNLSELGFSSAVVYSMYKPISEDDKETLCALLKFYRKVYFWVGIVVIIGGLGILPFLKVFIKGAVPSDVNIYILFLIFLSNTAIGYLTFGYKQALFNAYQRQDLISNVYSVTQLIMFICQLVLLLVFKNYYWYIGITPVFTIINNVLLSIFVNKFYPEIKCKGSLSVEYKSEIRKNVSGLLISKVCGVTRNSLDSIFISSFLGLTMTAIYSNYYLIFSTIIGFLVIFLQSMLGGIGNSIQTETKEKNYEDMKKFNFIYMWIGGWCTICLLCLYQPFMKFWMGDGFLLPFGAVILICLYFFLLKAGDMTSVYYDAVGIWWENRWRYILETIGNIVLNFILGKYFGIYGIIIATIITILFIGYLMGNQILFKKYFQNGQCLNYLIFIQGKNLIITTVIGVITLFICNLIKLPDTKLFNGLTFLINGLICLILPNVLYYLVFFKTKDFQIAKDWLLGFVKRSVR